MIEGVILLALPVAHYDCRFLADLKVPGLCIFGGGDPFGTSTELAQTLGQAPPGLEIHEIAGADHFFRGRTPLVEEAVQAHALAHELQVVDEVEGPVGLVARELAVLGVVDPHQGIDPGRLRLRQPWCIRHNRRPMRHGRLQIKIRIAWPAESSNTGMPYLMHSSMTSQDSVANFIGGTTKQFELLMNGRSRHLSSPPAIIWSISNAGAT